MKIETSISLAAAAISLFAFGVALWQGYVARLHNRLSVKPMLHFDCGITSDDFFINLKNTGIGPAIILNWRVSFSGQKIGENSDQIAINLFKELEVEHLGGEMYLPGKLQAMAAGDIYEILKINNVEADSEVKARIGNDILWLKVTVDYESIYGEKFSVSGPANVS